MADFMVRFLISNLFICGIIGILLTARHLFKNILSGRMQYHLWFLLLGLMAVPFVPFRLTGFPHLFSWYNSVGYFRAANAAINKAISLNQTETADWMNDFALSVNRNTSPAVSYILPGIWIAGMLGAVLLVIRSSLHLHALKKSALPLQNQKVRSLYQQCLREMKITKSIPVYSTAFLKSPVIMGLLKPCIYLPIHMIADYNDKNTCITRYMLLHELQHYKQKDILAGYAMSLAGIVYWFNPLVWYALKEMRGDREIACDTSVLDMLDADSYESYGNILINFAEKISLSPFPFTASLGGSMRQIERRIQNIASYEQPTFQKRLKSTTAFLLTAFILAGILLFGLSPVLSAYAASASHYPWDSASENISYVDLSAYFGTYEGSFVLYDEKNDSWHIHDMNNATLRVSPDSTYKIYDALFGLEECVITPDDSFIPWDGKTYPFEAWNTDQTLDSAMNASVNWYFQSVDRQLGRHTIKNYIQKISYGNEDISGEASSYWMESSLRISPAEQVRLLTKLHGNSFGFAPENINAMKDSIRLYSFDNGVLYGKTGTGRVDGEDVNGWFVGFAETADNTYFFAANIRSSKNAAGSDAARITMSVLNDSSLRFSLKTQ